MNNHQSDKLHFPDTLIIIFAREPVSGQVKTRLIPKLGAAGAMQLYTRLLDHAIDNVICSGLCPLEICITAESNADYFLNRYKKGKFDISLQSQGDLGDKMYEAMHSALKKYRKVVLIGSDCPFLTKEDFVQAIITLEKYNMVFSPASDGGYVLIGAKHMSDVVFKNIQWGSECVMSQTRKLLAANQLSWKELSEQHDIDAAEDLCHLPDILRY